jgi:hypothetical protein
MVTVGNSLNKNIAQLIQVIQSVFPRIAGAFTCAAAATTVVPQTAVMATSIILLSPTNAAAGTLMAGATSLYVSARTPGTSFAVATANGGAAAGTETFSYVIINPS